MQTDLTDYSYLVGKKIKLVYTNDKYTHHKAGDTGIVEEVNEVGSLFTQIWIRWSGSDTLGLALIPEYGDKWEVI